MIVLPTHMIEQIIILLELFLTIEKKLIDLFLPVVYYSK
jgi:hypothetical protein